MTTRPLAVSARTDLCGSVVVELEGVRIDDQLPSGRERAAFAYLVINRERSVSRDELIDCPVAESTAHLPSGVPSARCSRDCAAPWGARLSKADRHHLEVVFTDLRLDADLQRLELGGLARRRRPHSSV